MSLTTPARSWRGGGVRAILTPMTGPRRIQRKRRRGWRLPDGAVYVGRPTVWGNPFRVTRSSDYHGLPGSWFLMDEDGTTYHPDHDSQHSARSKAVELYAERVAAGTDPRIDESRIRSELAGRDLVCWCPIGEPCHVDVLLEIANSAPADPRPVTPPSSLTCPRCGRAHSARQHREGGYDAEGQHTEGGSTAH